MARPAALESVLDPRLSAFVDALPAALSGEATAVHQTRVASRRLREVVPIVTALDEAAARRARRVLRRMTRTLGRVREADVCAELLAELHEASPLHAEAAAAVRRAVALRRAGALRRFRRTWTRRRLERLHEVIDTVRVAAASGSRRDTRTAVMARLDTRVRRTRRAVAALGVLYVPDRLHAVRIAVKQWRYTLELATDLGLRRPSSALADMRAVQDELGRAHDLHVLAALVRAVEVRLVSRSRPAARDLRGLARRLEAECRMLHASFLVRPPLAGLVSTRQAGGRESRIGTAA